MKIRLLAPLAALLLLAGCQAPRPMYYWGNYEPTIYLGYLKPDKATPQMMATKLEEDLAKGAGKGLKANPGLHAQLGLVYVELGRIDEARAQFEAEKALFPDSAVFMDRFIAKLKPVAPAK